MRRKAKVPKVRACCKYGCCTHPGRWEDYYNKIKLKKLIHIRNYDEY